MNSNYYKNKGFTLVEIIVCVFLLSLVSTISVVTIKNNQIKNRTNEKIILASKTYDENKKYDKRCLRVSELLNEGYITENIQENLDVNKYIKISSDDMGYKDYDVVDSCKERYKITLKDEDTLYFIYYDIDEKSIHSNSTNTSKIDNVEIPKKNNKTFFGYYTKENGQGERVIDEKGNIDKKKLENIDSDNTIYYAYWIENYIVTLYDSKCINESKPRNLFYANESWYENESFSKKLDILDIPKKDGYNFDGYFLDSDDESTMYVKSNGVIVKNQSISENIKLYAKCSSKSYKVSLDKNGGNVDGTKELYLLYGVDWYSDSEYRNSVQKVTLPKKNGYTFQGYYTSHKSGKEVIKSNGDIIGNNPSLENYEVEEIKLYAHWDNQKYTISLNNGNANVSGTTQLYLKYNEGWYESKASTKRISSIKVPEKNGKIFKGYYERENGQGLQIIDENGQIKGNTTFTTSDKTLYAYWKTKTNIYIINYIRPNGYKVEKTAKVGDTVSVSGFSVSGNASACRTVTISKDSDNSMKNISVIIKSNLKFTGYSSAKEKTCQMQYTLKNDGSNLISYPYSQSCITRSGSTFWQSCDSWLTFNSNKIELKNCLSLSNTIGNANRFSLETFDITIKSEHK